jgi:hypothetical protein
VYGARHHPLDAISPCYSNRRKYGPTGKIYSELKQDDYRMERFIVQEYPFYQHGQRTSCELRRIRHWGSGRQQ